MVRFNVSFPRSILALRWRAKPVVSSFPEESLQFSWLPLCCKRSKFGVAVRDLYLHIIHPSIYLGSAKETIARSLTNNDGIRKEELE